MRSHPSLVAIQAGAHLTRTADFHQFSALNHTRLAAQGIAVAYPAAKGLRFGHAPVVWPDAEAETAALPRYAEAIAQRIAPKLQRATRALVISDADLLGPEHGLLDGRFYDGIGLRTTALRMALGRRADRVVLTIRPYDELFRAVWRTAAADAVIAPFATFARRMAAFTGGWIDVAEALQEVLEPETLVIRTDLSAPEVMLQTLVPGSEIVGLANVAAAAEVTASAAATLQRQYRLGVPMAAGQRERLIAFHALQKQDPAAEAGFDPLALADLRGRYVADLSILAQMPGIDLRGDTVPMMPRRYARAGA